MATKLVNGRKVLVDSQADPGSRKFLRESGGKQVTLKDGTQLNATQSREYGDTYSRSTLLRNSDAQNQILADKDPERFDRAADKAGFGTGKTPTVLTNAGIVEDKIPSLRNKTAQLPMLGEPQATDGAPQEESDFSIDEVLGISKKDKKKNAWDNLQARQDARANGTDENDDPQFDQMMGLLDEQKKISDRKTKEDIFRIESSMKRLKADQMASNASGIASVRNALGRAGASRYAPGGAAGVMSAASTAGVRALADLNMQEQELISQARSAQESSDYQLLEKKLGLIDSVRKEKAATAAALEKDMREKLSASSRDNAIANLIGQGITDPIKLIDMLNFTEDGTQVGDITIDEIENVLGAINKSDDPLDDLLSVEESKKLGVPFGTTKREALGKSVKTSDLGGLTPAQQAAAFKLADDYTAQSKDFFTVQNAYERVKSSAKNPSAAGDLALIFSFMKMLDPTSVVREQEFANAQNAAGVPERIRATYNNALKGERLTDTTRADFLTQAKGQFESQKAVQEQRNNTYGSRAEKFGIPRDFVVQSIDEIDTRTTDQKIQDLYNENPENKALIEDILTNEPDVTPEELIELVTSGPISMQAQRLADAIAMTESGNKQVSGASGEFGAFQFMPSTWASISKEVTGKMLPQTPANERMVASKKIEKLLATHTPEEVALIWNTSLGGTEEPRKIRGVNSKGVPYDSIAYAQKVLKNYNT